MGAGPRAIDLTERDREVLGVIAQHPGCVDRLVVRLCYQGTADGVNVPFFFKQWGGVQKHKAGRVLDGRTWDELPTVKAK